VSAHAGEVHLVNPVREQLNLDSNTRSEIRGKEPLLNGFL
jgi:hypothetical protein